MATPATSGQRLLPAAAVALAALLALFWTVTGLPSSGGVSALLVLLLALTVPVGLAVVAAGLARGRRLARAATALLVPLLAVMALTTSAGSGLLLGGALLCAGVSVALGLVPDLRAHVAPDRPRMAPSVSLVRTILALFASGSALAAVVSAVLLVGGLVGMSVLGAATAGEDSSLVAGVVGVVGGVLAALAVVVLVIHGGLAVFGFWARGALARREGVARILVTVAVSLGLLVVVVISASRSTFVGGGSFLGALLTLHLAVLVLLWLPPDTREHFGDRPIGALEDLRRRLAATTGAAAVTSPARACAACGGGAEPGWSHCPRCGARLVAGAWHLGS